MGRILEAFQLFPAYTVAVAVLFGLLLGSFLNVAAIRVPKGESVVFPPSRCASCGHRLGPLDLIPVFGFLLLRGKCRYCGESISVQYPVWEALTAALFGLLAWKIGPEPELIAGMAMVSLLIPVAQTDLRERIIPDKIARFGLGTGILLRLFVHPLPPWNYAAAFALAGGLLYALAWGSVKCLGKEGIGGGDIKLFAVLGLFLGLKLTLLALFFASFIGTAIGVLLLALGKLSREEPLPFAPFLAIGAVTAYVWGETIVRLCASMLS